MLSLHPCEKDPEVVHKLKGVIQVHLTAERNKHDKQISKPLQTAPDHFRNDVWRNTGSCHDVEHFRETNSVWMDAQKFTFETDGV